MAPVQRKRISISLLIPFLIIILVFTALIWRKYQASRIVPHVQQTQPEVSGTRSAVLFFATPSGTLVRESRELDSCDDADSCMKDLLDELLNGPIGDFEQPLPDGTLVNSVTIIGETAAIDLNRIFAEALPSGSSAEMLAVYSIVDTVIVNTPQIKKVKLTVEGNDKAHLRHLDLSEPLGPDYTLELPYPPVSPPLQKEKP